VWHSWRNPDGSWQTFGDVTGRAEVAAGLHPGPLSALSCTKIGDRLHVVGASPDGKVWHSWRNPDGSWQTFGDVTGRAEVAAGLRPGPLSALGSVGIGALLHVVGANPDGKVWHSWRNPDGSWQTFGDVTGRAEVAAGLRPGPLSALSCSGGVG